MRGWPPVADLNADFADGYGALPLSSTLSRRVSAASAYLDAETRARPNLRIECDATVERLVFEGARCVGVTVESGGRRRTERARHVVLSAGGIWSPTLLMRSGVGPANQLERHGIPVVAKLDGVGANLQNHPIAYLATHVRRTARQSPLLRPQFHTGLRISTGDDAERRGDLLLMPINKSSWHGVGAMVGGIGVTLMRPLARGSVGLRSADPAALPDVRFDLLGHPLDFDRMVYGLGVAVELLRDDAVRPLRNELFAAGYSRVVRGLNRPGTPNKLASRALARLLDGPPWLRRALIARGIAAGDIDEDRMSERSWQERTIRKRAFGTFHPAGTCRMGNDEHAVVDASCAVHGLEGLSVVDASIIPTLTRANTFLPTVMIAERAADRLAGRAAA
jgi:5-(hydroxymethyl)furfural/furfural oxidase